MAGYTKIVNSVINDQYLTPAAIGIYCIIAERMSRPRWKFTKTEAMQAANCGREAFETHWKELVEAGYLIVTRTNTARGMVYKYELRTEPAKDRKPPKPRRRVWESGKREKEEKPTSGNPDSYTRLNNINDDDKGAGAIPDNPEKVPEAPAPTLESQYIDSYAPEAVRHDQEWNAEKLAETVRKSYPGATLENLAAAMADAVKAFNGYKKRITCPFRLFRRILINALNLVIYGPKKAAGPADQVKQKAPAKASATTSGHDQKAPASGNQKKPGWMFHNFEQRNNDYDALLKLINAADEERENAALLPAGV